APSALGVRAAAGFHDCPCQSSGILKPHNHLGNPPTFDYLSQPTILAESRMRSARHPAAPSRDRSLLRELLEMGYHETITQAFVRLIDGAIRRSGVCADS